MKYKDITFGKIEALINKMGGLQVVDHFLRGDFILTEVDKGYKTLEDGLITLKATSHGHTGPEQERFLKERGYNVTKWASEILNHEDFTWSPKGTELQIGILTYKVFKAHSNFKDLLWTPGNAWKFLQEVYGVKDRPTHDIGGLLREHLSDKQIEEMGLWGIPTLSDPLKDSDGLLCAPGPYRDGDSRLNGWGVRPGNRYYSRSSFAFVVPQ